MSLKVLHKHIFAAKLRELLARSEILCVYQALSGDVSAAALAADANARLPAGVGFRAEACRMRNAVAAATGDPLMQTLFHTSNVIVGFTPVVEPAGQEGAAAGQGGAAAAAAAAAPAAPAAPAAAAPATAAGISIRDMLSGLLPPPADGRPQRPHLPQPAVAALLGAALELPRGRPLALLGALYRRRPLPLGHMRQWQGLDAAQVHGGLVQALGAPAGDVIAPLQALLDDLAGAVDVEAAGAGGVVAALEHRRQRGDEAAAGAGAAAAADGGGGA